GSTLAPRKGGASQSNGQGYGGVIKRRLRGRGGSLLECGIALNARPVDSGRTRPSSPDREWPCVQPVRPQARAGQALRRARLLLAGADGRQRSGLPPQQLRVRNSTTPFMASKSAR